MPSPRRLLHAAQPYGQDSSLSIRVGFGRSPARLPECRLISPGQSRRSQTRPAVPSADARLPPPPPAAVFHARLPGVSDSDVQKERFQKNHKSLTKKRFLGSFGLRTIKRHRLPDARSSRSRYTIPQELILGIPSYDGSIRGQGSPGWGCRVPEPRGATRPPPCGAPACPSGRAFGASEAGGRVGEMSQTLLASYGRDTYT